MDLNQQTLILTGASRGIGEAVALELSKAGASLVLNARNPEALEHVVEDCRALGAQVRAVVGDASQDQTVQFMVKAAKVLGNFGGFIHNAAVLHSGPLVTELSETHFDELVAVNLKASYLLARYAYPNLLRSGGGLAVFLGSGATELNFPGSGVYGATKAAEEYLAKQLALEHPSITCFVYRPGHVDTAMQAHHRSAEGSGGPALRERFGGSQKRGELHSPQEVAQALVRLLVEKPQQYHGTIVQYRA
ncbi:SDR family oxidoreductase [uncultured Meiothermus sp.]|jgi:NAD(P)-dependent dehydrogenase (short-subunit alcohol dehydrogenase family)|uniref:SDR family NAD(P)-dependent oxidoreductase n=1 Tax=uncultured Meiothermus sp. TaxID=157471 RepID=UPI002627755D|nr:SDR family oxidoreductase [uncultured Meiothermus sp.]